MDSKTGAEQTEDDTAASFNQNVVNEITKDLENLAVADETVEPPNSSPSAEEIMEEMESRDSASNCSDDEPAGEAIDEEYLRELEKNQTDEDKAKLKESALKLKEEGNTLFRDGKFGDAIKSYTMALQSCPVSFTVERSILYANRATARMKMDLNEEGVMDCTKALDLNPNYTKAVLRRAQLYQKLEKLDEALADYQRVLELDGNVLEAREAVLRLPEQINERNEKLKTEMMGKLKDLGNMFLRPFGLSTDNFNLVKDENTGGYSVNFQQNTPKQ